MKREKYLEYAVPQSKIVPKKNRHDVKSAELT